jgi:hypothetical protein
LHHHTEHGFGPEGGLSKIFQLDGEKGSLSFVPGQRITYVAEGHRICKLAFVTEGQKKL